MMINTNIDFKLDENLLRKLLKVRRDTLLFEEAMSIANDKIDYVKPKFILKKLEKYKVNETGILIDNIKLNSRILGERIKESPSVFVFVATGGIEIMSHIDSLSDYFEKYVLDQVAYMGCLWALEKMEEALKKIHNISNYISLAPGSLPDWDVIETKKLFELMKEDYKKIGVQILESGMVEPIKTISGILFQSEDSFNSCELCMRQKCPTRRGGDANRLQD